MVTVRFLNLLRSTYRVEQLQVKPGSLSFIIDQILNLVPIMKIEDFNYVAIFVNQVKIVNINYDQEMIKDGDVLVFTHFVGGG
jgi:molybdopterin converting factor small subunit